MEFTNLPEFNAALHRELERFGHEAHSDYNKADAEKLADRMGQLVHVESGETKGALGVTEAEAEGEKAWLVGADPDKVDNAKVLSEEFGTSTMTPRAFARPAMAEMERGGGD